MKYWLPAFFLLIAPFNPMQNIANGTIPDKTILDIRVPHPPRPVRIAGLIQLCYELHFTNNSADSLLIQRIEISDGKSSSPYVVFSGKEIRVRLHNPNLPGGTDSVITEPGATGIVYIEITLENLPDYAKLQHRLIYQKKGENPGKAEITSTFITQVIADYPIILGPPLKEGPWAAIYEPSWQRGHRRVFYTVNDKARIPGRFAIDFIKLDERGQLASGERNLVRNWYGYGLDVIAVADGTISTTRDDFAESSTLSGHPLYPSSQATGNYISLDIGKKQFVFYEHLKPGTIRVRPGQKVKKGDLLASVGFTGQSSGPHLHLHVADTDSPLGAEGLPFVFENFILAGAYPDISQFEKSRWEDYGPGIETARQNERPAANSVIRFK